MDAAGCCFFSWAAAAQTAGHGEPTPMRPNMTGAYGPWLADEVLGFQPGRLSLARASSASSTPDRIRRGNGSEICHRRPEEHPRGPRRRQDHLRRARHRVPVLAVADGAAHRSGFPETVRRKGFAGAMYSRSTITAGINSWLAEDRPDRQLAVRGVLKKHQDAYYGGSPGRTRSPSAAMPSSFTTPSRSPAAVSASPTSRRASGDGRRSEPRATKMGSRNTTPSPARTNTSWKRACSARVPPGRESTLSRTRRRSTSYARGRPSIGGRLAWAAPAFRRAESAGPCFSAVSTIGSSRGRGRIYDRRGVTSCSTSALHTRG